MHNADDAGGPHDDGYVSEQRASGLVAEMIDGLETRRADVLAEAWTEVLRALPSYRNLRPSVAAEVQASTAEIFDVVIASLRTGRSLSPSQTRLFERIGAAGARNDISLDDVLQAFDITMQVCCRHLMKVGFGPRQPDGPDTSG